MPVVAAGHPPELHPHDLVQPGPCAASETCWRAAARASVQCQAGRTATLFALTATLVAEQDVCLVLFFETEKTDSERPESLLECVSISGTRAGTSTLRLQELSQTQGPLSSAPAQDVGRAIRSVWSLQNPRPVFLGSWSLPLDPSVQSGARGSWKMVGV